jgi:putative acetyltransferase
MSVSIDLTSTSSPELVALARQLFLEYADAIGVDLEYQGFSAELDALPSPYKPPHGRLLLAHVDGNLAGCAALRRLDDHAGEMKRLYVRPEFRSLGLARRLVAAIVLAARNSGCSELRLDTLPSMTSAQGLYRALGFKEIPSYNNTHLPGTRFYSLQLTGKKVQNDKKHEIPQSPRKVLPSQ